MATKSPDITSVYGTDAMQKYLDAQRQANEVLEERNNRLFDPTMLAMAQGFLAPTKTGGFGESLGNVAAAVGPAQAAEEKRTMDMAKMRLEMAQQGLQTEIQQKQAETKQRLINEDLGSDSPYYKPPAPAVAPQPAPQPAPAGGLPSAPQAPPVAPPVLSAAQPQQAPQQAPQQPPMAQAPQEPVGTPLFPAQPEGFTAQEKMDYKRGLAAGKDPYEIRKDIMETRRKNIQVNQAGTSGVNLATGQKFGFDPTPTKTYIHGVGSVEIPASEAIMLGNAKDAEDYERIKRMIMFGHQKRASAVSTTGAPAGTPTGAAPAGAPTQSARPTIAQAEANAAALKAESEKAGTGRGARTSTVMDKVDPAIEVRGVAQTAKDLVSQEGAEKVFGIFEKPTIRAALAKMVDEGSFTPVGFRDAMVAANVRFNVEQKPNEKGEDYERRKQDILDRYYQMGTQVARAKFEASTLAKGQGAFSDGERRMFADTTISTKMSVNSINKTADMLLARANFAENLANAIEDSTMSYDKFRRTPEYQNMLKNYENQLRSIWSGKAPQRSGGARPDLDAAQANIERQLR